MLSLAIPCVFFNIRYICGTSSVQITSQTYPPNIPRISEKSSMVKQNATHHDIQDHVDNGQLSLQDILSNTSSNPPKRDDDNAHRPVGTLNGYDMYLVNETPRTKVHCVGDTYQEETSWLFRSCKYDLLCFDMDRLDFVIFQDDLSSTLPNGWYSSTLRQKDPVTGIEVNAKPRNNAIYSTSDKQPGNLFYPQILESVEPPSSYYLLNVTIIPFFRYHIGYRNPGHHLWQDLVSLYTLIDMFDKEDANILLVPLKQKVAKEYYREGNADLMNKWGSKLVGMANFDKFNPFWEDGEFDFRIDGQPVSQKSLSSRIVCGQDGLTGMGQFSYHETHHHNGTHLRGEQKKMNQDLVPAQNGKAGFFRRMRRFLMRKAGVHDFQRLPSSHSTILFSQNSSRRGKRANGTFHTQIEYLKSEFPESQVRIEATSLASLSVEEQIQKLSQTDIFLSATGGGSASAIFLPPGAHLILFYEDWFLDWDYWNNMADIHVHWIPIEDLEDFSQLSNLKLLIEECLGVPGLPPAWKRKYNISVSEQAPKSALTVQVVTPTNGTGLCHDYDGILHISRVFLKAAAGTFFFQSIVDALLYAQQYNLYPFIWVDQVLDDQPCFDRKVHGSDLQGSYSHLHGRIKNAARLDYDDKKRGCRHEPGSPNFTDTDLITIELHGNGIWQSYFQMTHPIPFLDPTCRQKPVFSLSQDQLLPGLHYCSALAVRGWVYPWLEPRLQPNEQSIREWLSDHRQRASQIVREHFELQPWLRNLVDDIQPVNERCLGVHIRLTDKGSGRIKRGVDAYLPYLEAYVRAVGGPNNMTTNSTIFLATDDATVLHQLKNRSDLLFHSAVIRHQEGALLSDSDAPTFAAFSTQKHRLNTEALVDIYALSRCQYLVHGYSAIAEAAVYVNPHLDQFSINVDDPDAPSPLQLEEWFKQN